MWEFVLGALVLGVGVLIGFAIGSVQMPKPAPTIIVSEPQRPVE